MAAAFRLAALLLVSLALVHSAQGRRLKQVVQVPQCPTLAQLAEILPEATEILSIIDAHRLMPHGLPPGATIFLPTNNAVLELPDVLGLPFASDVFYTATAALGPAVNQRIKAILLYHISPIGGLDPDSLAVEADLPTALVKASLVFTGPTPQSTYLLTDAAGRQAQLMGDPWKAMEVCGSVVYIIDHVLLPGKTFPTIDPISKDTAEQLLAMLGTHSDVSSAPAPAGAPAAAPTAS